MFNGKALYNPQGRSGEYSQWAVNFFNGCTGGCEYCYNKRFPLLSATKPTLKACFKDENEAIETAQKEILQNKWDIIRDGGVFLSFVSDPMLPETIKATMAIVMFCSAMGQQYQAIPVSILTKRADFVLNEDSIHSKQFKCVIRPYENNAYSKDIAFGFTLTGHDELEPGCSSNADRIKAMKILHDKGFRTWASIEPVIDFRSSIEMIRACAPFCDHFKVGLRTDKKFECSTTEFVNFVNGIRETINKTDSTVYFKRSIRALVGGQYIFGSKFVEEGFNMFTQKQPDFKKIFE